MPLKKEVKKLDQDLVAAIEWVAAEFEYVQKLKEEIEKVEHEDDPEKDEKELKNALRILIYISRAERRAFKFEEQVGKDLQQIYDELSKHLETDFSAKHELIKQIRSFIDEIKIERDNLLKYASMYEGLLKTELNKAEAEAQLLANIEEDHQPKKAKKVHDALLLLIKKVQKQVGEIEEWIGGLEATLRNAKTELEKILEEEAKRTKVRKPLVHRIRHSRLYRYIMDIIPPGLRNYIREINYDLASFYQYKRFDMFSGIAIETTPVCNRKCSYCPNSDKGLYKLRPKKRMNNVSFRTIIDQLAEINFKGVVALQHYGEPLLDKKLDDKIKYTRSKLKHAQIEFNSNGDFLTIERFHLLIKSGLSRVRVTNHNPHGNFSDNMQKMIAYLKENPHLRRYIVVRNGIETLYNRGGLVDIPDDQRRKLKHCVQEMHNINVDVNGNVVLCASDYLGKVKFGNVFQKDIIKIWYSEEYKRIRKELRNGIFSKDICQNCTS